VLAAPAALFAVWWYIATRERAGTTVPVNESARVPFREALKRVLRIKQIWLLSLFMFGVYGAYISLVGYLPTYLREIGWAGVQADTALTVFLGSLAGCAPLMALVSDRLGSRKKVIVPAALVAALALALLPWVGTSAVWVLLIVQGVFRSGLIALFVSLVMETEGIGATYVGTAIGVAISIMTLGAAVLPPLGNALADIHLGLPMVFWAAVSVVLMVPLIFVKEAR
jgi:Na+/melibiose symporter-like transporter